jgi:hypothetical protein
VSRKPLDAERRTRLSAGIGSATLNPSGTADIAPEEIAELSGAWSFHGTLARRLTPPRVPITLAAAGVAHVVPAASVTGTGATNCHVQWGAAGPALMIDGPTTFRVWFSGDVGVVAVRASRSACRLPGSATTAEAAARLSPAIGFSINFGLTHRIGWNIRGHWVQPPLHDIGLTTAGRWTGAGAVSAVIAF